MPSLSSGCHVTADRFGELAELFQAVREARRPAALGKSGWTCASSRPSPRARPELGASRPRQARPGDGGLGVPGDPASSAWPARSAPSASKLPPARQGRDVAKTATRSPSGFASNPRRLGRIPRPPRYAGRTDRRLDARRRAVPVLDDDPPRSTPRPCCCCSREQHPRPPASRRQPDQPPADDPRARRKAPPQPRARR